MANPPPPYDNITGISRAVMKDNAQETLSNYNGNARPGELVVDLTQDPPPLYVGNNAGALTLVTSSSGGLPLANGDSYFNIAVASGNVEIGVDDSYFWIFDTSANLNLPTNGSIIVDGGDGVIGPVSDDMVISWDNEEIRLVSVQGSIEMQADNAFRVQTNYDGGTDTYTSRWEFNQNEIVNITNDFNIVTEAGDLRLQGGRDTLSSGNVEIVSVNNGVAINTWTFDTAGNLNISSEGKIVGITANNNGSMQWAGNSSGDGAGYTTLRLVPDDTLTSGDQYIIIDPTAPGHIHIRAGGTQDNSSASLFLGGENSYFRVTAGANADVTISANSHQFVYGEFGYGVMRFPLRTYAQLPQSPLIIAGQKAFLTDANLAASGNFGANVSGGGSNVVPVWSDGINWYIG